MQESICNSRDSRGNDGGNSTKPSEKLRLRQDRKQQHALASEAARDIKKHKPEIVENPLLRSLEAALLHQSKANDPFLDQRHSVDAFEKHQHYVVTLEAIREIYAEALETKGIQIDDLTLRWIEYLIAEAEGLG